MNRAIIVSLFVLLSVIYGHSKEKIFVDSLTITLESGGKTPLFDSTITVTYHKRRMISTLSFEGIKGISLEQDGIYDRNEVVVLKGNIFYIKINSDVLYRGQFLKIPSKFVTFNLLRLNTETTYSYKSSALSFLAEDLHKSIALNAKVSRYVSGSLGLIAGSLTMALGAVLLSEENLKGAQTVGGIFLGLGAITNGFSLVDLISPSQSEVAYEKIKKIAEVNEKERFGYESLISLSKKSEKNRKMRAGFLSTISLLEFILAYQDKDNKLDNIALGSIGALGAIYLSLSKSTAEEALERYKAEKFGFSSLSLQIGTYRHRYLGLGLTYHF